jgi:hypothetical protein
MAHHCVQMAAEAKVRMYGGELVKSLWVYTSASHSSRCGGREKGYRVAYLERIRMKQSPFADWLLFLGGAIETLLVWGV